LPLEPSDYFTLGNSIILGWITLDLVANLFLVKDKGGAHIRIFVSHHYYTRRTNAVLAQFSQFVLALLVSFFIYDFWAFVITAESFYLLPITMVTGVILYLYILLGLPKYKIKTWIRLGPAVLVLVLAVMFSLLIYFFTA
jgi:hypothetical protein